MPIDTPDKALLLSELPTASANDAGIQAIVTTNTGAKKLPIQQIFEPYNIFIGSYVHYAGNIPAGFAVPLLGGILDPDDFEDRLQTFKQRIPADWILHDGRVQLPTLLDHVLQQDILLQPGDLQEDAVQKIYGEITAFNMSGSGDFKHKQDHGQWKFSNGGGGDPRTRTYELNPSIRMAKRTREQTINTVLCILTGKNKAVETKKYYLIHPEHGEYLGWSISLAAGKNGGIGFNPKLMSEEVPNERPQASLADDFSAEISSDPLGIAMRMKLAEKSFSFDFFSEIYKTFRIDGVDVLFSASKQGIKLTYQGGSLLISGAVTYESNSLFNSSYGVGYNSTSCLVDLGVKTFTVSGLPNVQVKFRMKAGIGLLQFNLDSNWFNRLKELCPPENGPDLNEFLAKIPNRVVNQANFDRIDSNVDSRFYFYSDKFKQKTPTQAQIRAEFQSAVNSDKLNQAVRESNFNLSNFVNDREFVFFGQKLSIEADMSGVRFKTKAGYYWGVKSTPEVGSFSNIDGQNQQIRYNFTNRSWIFGGPEMEEIQATDGYAGVILIYAKGRCILLANSVTFAYNYVDLIKNKAPAGREQDLKRIFNNLPPDFENTLNQDNIGSNNGERGGRFWMIESLN